MFSMHIAAMQGYVVIALGVILVIWSMRNQGKGTLLARVVGGIIITIAILSQLGIYYYGKQYYDQGYFEKPTQPLTKIDIL